VIDTDCVDVAVDDPVLESDIDMDEDAEEVCVDVALTLWDEVPDEVLVEVPDTEAVDDCVVDAVEVSLADTVDVTVLDPVDDPDCEPVLEADDVADDDTDDVCVEDGDVISHPGNVPAECLSISSLTCSEKLPATKGESVFTNIWFEKHAT
jgi:hypothetical protein